MTEPTIDAILAEIRETCAEATPGDWSPDKPIGRVGGFSRGVTICAVMGGARVYGDPPGGQFPANDRRHIVATQPVKMTKVLAHIDDIAQERDALRKRAVQAEERRDVARSAYVRGFQQHEAPLRAHIDALTAERDRLTRKLDIALAESATIRAQADDAITDAEKEVATLHACWTTARRDRDDRRDEVARLTAERDAAQSETASHLSAIAERDEWLGSVAQILDEAGVYAPGPSGTSNAFIDDRVRALVSAHAALRDAVNANAATIKRQEHDAAEAAATIARLREALTLMLAAQWVENDCYRGWRISGPGSLNEAAEHARAIFADTAPNPVETAMDKSELRDERDRVLGLAKALTADVAGLHELLQQIERKNGQVTVWVPMAGGRHGASFDIESLGHSRRWIIDAWFKQRDAAIAGAAPAAPTMAAYEKKDRIVTGFRKEAVDADRRETARRCAEIALTHNDSGEGAVIVAAIEKEFAL